jgi:hypothetical protein
MKGERRRSQRIRVAVPPGLRLTVPEAAGKTRSVAAKLVDVSGGGVGIESFVRVPSGAVVDIEGDLRNSDLSLHISGRARVAHVSEIERGRYRIGLQFVDVALARTA